MKRWRGLIALIEDGFVAGTDALERVQKESAVLPFAVLEALPVLRAPARAVHATHDATLSIIYALLRIAGQTAGRSLDATLAACEVPGAGRPGSSPQVRQDRGPCSASAGSSGWRAAGRKPGRRAVTSPRSPHSGRRSRQA